VTVGLLFTLALLSLSGKSHKLGSASGDTVSYAS
jgi:hypothetical protein